MRNPPHPGNVLRSGCLGDEPVADVAHRMGVPAADLASVLEGRAPITPRMAWAMDLLEGWPSALAAMNLQVRYDLARERLQQERQAA